jgi:hypothetical protein
MRRARSSASNRRTKAGGPLLEPSSTGAMGPAGARSAASSARPVSRDHRDRCPLRRCVGLGQVMLPALGVAPPFWTWWGEGGRHRRVPSPRLRGRPGAAYALLDR